MFTRKNLFIILLLLQCPVLVFAQDFYQGVRQMGMGGAAIAVVNDETSLLLNPNGLARLREPYITLIDIEATSRLNHTNEIGSLGFGAIDPEEIYNELSDTLDKDYFFRAQTFPSFANRGYGFGVLGRYEVRARRSSVDQSLNLNYTSDWVGVAGYNHSFWGGIVKIGATGKLIDRVEFNGVVPSAQSKNPDNLTSEGMGLGVDVGVTLSSPTDLLPTVSLVARDIGDTSFTMSDGLRDQPNSPVPGKIPFSLDAAVAIFPIMSRDMRGTFTVEMDDLLKNGPFEDAVRRLHAGMEVNYMDAWFFRAGYNRGYITGGFEWATQFTQLQLAYYGEEIGTDVNPVKEERVTVKLIFRF